MNQISMKLKYIELIAYVEDHSHLMIDDLSYIW